jgi:peptidoglycan/xylan/chitin deacetylase (PgdA/CDA1 family)
VPLVLFRKQMRFLKENGYRVIGLNEYLEETKEKNRFLKTVILNFEDGYADNYLNAFPVLKEFGFKAVFLPIVGCIDSKESFPWLEERPFPDGENLPLSSAQILEMAKEGMEIASHGLTHKKCRTQNLDEAEYEFAESKKRLEAILGKPVTSFAYPYGSPGDFNLLHKDLLRKIGYQCVLSSIIGSNSRAEPDMLELKRIPVYGTDSLSDFQKKVEGTYDWVGGVQCALSSLKSSVIRRKRP